MRAVPAGPAYSRSNPNQWVLLLALLGVTLGILFSQSFKPQEILFNNDTPLGTLKSEQARLPDRFAGSWYDTTWLGGAGATAVPTITTILGTIMPRELFLKIYAPLTLLFVGFSAWIFFRSLRFNPTVCVLGGVAAGLNAHFFSIACWGQGSWEIAAGMVFLAMAALTTKSIKQRWAKSILAGLAVGLGVMEGFDLGAILSVYVGVFVLFQTLNEEGSAGKKVMSALLSEALVVFFAGFIATETIVTLVETQIEGVSAMQQDDQTKQQRWNAATQWSLPKAETLQLFVPGLFGYRMAQHILKPDHSSAYWGNIGRDPRIDGLGSDDPEVRKSTAALFNVPPDYREHLNTATRHERTQPMIAITKKSGIYWRYSGTGDFTGVLVSLLAIFAVAIVWRAQTPFSKVERRAVIFWACAALFSLLTAWGRYGFLYKILYQIPYVSTIRNPIKFLHPFHIAWVVLAAYGMEALYRTYLREAARRSDFFPDHLRIWWSKAAGFDKKWTIFALLLLGSSIAGLIVLDASQGAIRAYMEDQAIPAQEAGKMAAFCLVHAVWFVVFLALSVLVVTGIISGAWSGPGIKWAWSLLGILLIVDLARADEPWVRYFDYGEKYSPNPIVDFLQDKPYEHRVIGKLEPRGPGSGITPGFGEVYFFWIQNDFPYHNIESLDFSQASHMPDLDRDYLKAFELKGTDIRGTDLFPAMRLWQLTNTRYILAASGGVDMLNARASRVNMRFHIIKFFNLEKKLPVPDDVGDLTAVEGPKGQYAMIDFSNALPRVKLYSNWAVPTNDATVLTNLADPAFDPEKSVLVSSETPVTKSSAAPGSNPGEATITQYHPKFIQIQADAKTPAVLLLNDRIAPNWQVFVDHQRADLLRCNYIMRGVYLSPGSHTVEFRYRPPLKTLFVTLCAICVGIGVAGYLFVTRPPTSAPPAKPPAPPPPGPSQAQAQPQSQPQPQTAKPVAGSAQPFRQKGRGKGKARRV
jgi:hypothetical protein